MDKMQSPNMSQYMPMGCGAFNSGMAIPASMPYAPQQTAAAVQQPVPGLPTGFPTGGTASPLLPSTAIVPSSVTVPGIQGGGAEQAPAQVPITVSSPLYTPGFLRTQIGQKVRVEFLIGNGAMTDRSGTLLAVGASYILIRIFGTDDPMMCDIYSIKFVTILK